MIPPLTRILGGIGLSGAGVMATILSLNKPTSTPASSEVKVVRPTINWDNIFKETKEECGNGTTFTWKSGSNRAVNDKDKTYNEWHECKKRVEEKGISEANKAASK